MYKFKNNLSPLIVTDLFTRHTAIYNLRQNKTLETSNIDTVLYGMETVSYCSPKTFLLENPQPLLSKKKSKILDTHRMHM